jgi:hypothetical protein
MPDTPPRLGAQPNLANPAGEPGPLPRPAASRAGYPSGWLLLANPGTPPQPIPDEFGFTDVVDLIAPGGHVIMRAEPDGPAVAHLYRATEPQVKCADADAGRRATVQTAQATQPATAPSMTAAAVTTTVTIKQAQYVHVYNPPAPASGP